MKKITKLKNWLSSSNNSKNFGRALTLCLIIGIATIFGFIIYYINTPEEGFIDFYVLNEEQEFGNYPSNVTRGENVTFYLCVENHIENDFNFRIKYGPCNSTTWIDPTPSGCSNSTLSLVTENITVASGESWGPMPVNVSFQEEGNFQMVIFELWKIYPDNHEEFLFVKKGMYVKIMLNVTAS
ncbi:MAG: DUF1616 domain-containing protein [Promethearchaeota archaeon]